VVVLIAGFIAILGGAAAIAIDLSSYIADRRDLQNDADAIALAASLDLPNGTAATTAGEDWAAKNNIDDAEIEDIEIIAQNAPTEPNPKVRVTLTRDHSFTFARLIGINSAAVSTTATAIKTSFGGGDGIVPLSVTEEVLSAATLGTVVTLKYDANSIMQGNTNPIRIDGPGAGNCNDGDGYCHGLMYGSNNVVCAAGADDTYCDGPSVVDTQTGNVLGKTRDAINFRLCSGVYGSMDHCDTAAHCDSFAEVFEDDPISTTPGDYRLVQDCNPFIESSYDSNRVLIIPVIDEMCNGSCAVTIVDFALFFLDGFAPGTNCRTGNTCEVVGTFVRANQNIGFLSGTFNPDSSNSFVRLVE
jgi:hypothetical protein